jgi:uncharacterized protein with PQ loop repeat
MKLNRLLIIGYIATFLTIVHLIPQVYKIYITNHTLSLSIYTHGILFCESLLWIIYGYLTNNYLLSFGNMINILFLVYILNKIISNNYKLDLEEDIEINLKKIEQLKWL